MGLLEDHGDPSPLGRHEDPPRDCRRGSPRPVRCGRRPVPAGRRAGAPGSTCRCRNGRTPPPGRCGAAKSTASWNPSKLFAQGNRQFHRRALPVQPVGQMLVEQQHEKGKDDGDQAQGQCHAVAAGDVGVLVDGQGNRLGHPGNVAGDDDGGAEFPQAAGEHEGGAGQQRAAGEGQNDGKEGIVPMRAEGARGLDELTVDPLHADADGTHQERKADHRRGDHRRMPGEDDADSQRLQPAADPALLAETQQQQIADHHRRQDQGEVDDPVEHRLAPHAGEDEQIGGGETEGKRGQGGDRRHPRREPDGLVIGGGQIEHECRNAVHVMRDAKKPKSEVRVPRPASLAPALWYNETIFLQDLLRLGRLQVVIEI